MTKGLVYFCDKKSLHKTVQASLDGLASQLLDIQRVYIDNIISYTTSGTSDAIRTVKELVLHHITDPDLQTILNIHLDELVKFHNTLVVCIQNKMNEDMKGMYSKHILLEMLRRWRSASSLELNDIDTPTPDPSQPASTPTDTATDSETVSVASDQRTLVSGDPQILANKEVSKCGFLFSDLSPEDLYKVLTRSEKEVSGGLDMSQTDLVQFLTESFLEPYLSTIETKTRDTIQGPIRMTRQACESMMNRILVDRQREMKERLEKKQEPGQSDDRVLHHLLVWGNLVAAQYARKILFERLNNLPKLLTHRTPSPSTIPSTSSSTPLHTP